MSLALHGHHVLLIATLAFITAVLTPNWYTSSNQPTLVINIFQICNNSLIPNPCSWTYKFLSENSSFVSINLIYPILLSSLAIGCVLISLISLFLSSWYLHRHTPELLLSCAVWTIMLTTNLQQDTFGTHDIRLKEFGFSFWINIGSSAVYLYTLIIYLIAVCKG
ncbi:hypothetical protein I4U23_021278 [Adineta vaga]|nr:hypothetical protein I4U23_021278 [Adineta vaga]